MWYLKFCSLLVMTVNLAFCHYDMKSSVTENNHLKNAEGDNFSQIF